MKTLWIRWRPVAAGATLLLLIYIIFRGYGENSCNVFYEREPSLEHVKEYCRSPHGSASGQEGEVTTMKDGSKLSLVSVHTVIRHGDRNNLHTLPNYNTLSLSCQFSDDFLEQHPVMREYVANMEENLKRGPRQVSQAFHGWHIYPNNVQCESGMLTPIGATQHVFNGQLFKQKYSTKHDLFGGSSIEQSVRVISTNKSRTFQSAMALLYGFLPELDISKLDIHMATNASMCTGNSGHVCTCKAADPYADVMSSTYMQTSPQVRKSVMADHMYAALSKVFDTPSNDLPRPSHFMDVAMVHFCHSEHLPGAHGLCMPSWTVRDVYDVLAENGAKQAKNSDFIRICRLKMQPLLHEMADRMIQQGSGKTPVKFVLYSGHDSTIDPLAVALNFTTGLWSPYASRIVFELYKGELRSQQTELPLFIRVLYNGQVVTSALPFCGKSVTDGTLGLCPLNQFVKFVRKDNLHQMGESHYDAACSKSIGSVLG